MIRWFVKHEHVRLLQHEAAEEQPRRFTARERLGGLQRGFTREEQAPEDAADLLLRGLLVERVEPLERVEARRALAERLVVVLREIADGGVVAPADLAGALRSAMVGDARPCPSLGLSGR